MKKLILALLVATVGLTVQSYAQTGPDADKKEDREVKREEREKAREQKQAAFERFVDSLVMTHSFRFLPQDFQMQPAGRLRQIG
ncbi:MAG: hypothetical protein LBU95_06145, partial [Rikenellaceae bacterium]|nr:hypothetical protein [Rikenellaceae bacterium]